MDTKALTERERFEAWAATQPRHEGASMRFLGLNNAYIDFDLHGAWLAWQARASAPQEPAPDLATPSGGLKAGPEEDRIEAAYWRFDARRKGYGQWKTAPMSERDAFKAEMRNALGAEKTRAQMRLIGSGWRKPQEPAPASQAEEALEWSGAVPFVTMVQSLAAPDAGPWGDEFLAWYEPERWFGEHRACAIWLGEKMKAQASPASQAGVREALAELDDAISLEGFGCSCEPRFPCATCKARDVLSIVRKPLEKLRAVLSQPTQAQEKDAARKALQVADDLERWGANLAKGEMLKLSGSHAVEMGRRVRAAIDSAIAASTAKEKT
jgi:hypothetical protein